MSEKESATRDQLIVEETKWPEDSSPKTETTQSKIFRLLAISGRIILALVALSVVVVLCLRWVPPPTSAFMLARQWESFFFKERQTALRYQWVAWKSISPYMPLAVVAAEDQKFPSHWGFDLESIREAMDQAREGNRLRGASTITQQVAKNLFLWSGRSYVRKGLEAYITLLLELLWPKKRILEVYVNIAEFGDGVYGVQAAAETFLRKSPSDLTKREAVLLAAVLPNPKQLEVRNPSQYVRKKVRWIEEQMGQLGGIGYLQNL